MKDTFPFPLQKKSQNDIRSLSKIWSTPDKVNDYVDGSALTSNCIYLYNNNNKKMNLLAVLRLRKV